ncbi:hypothetical protein [Hydrocoleum sp. CS-953]|uniref:hypothetical protein n=1 Tax=Microcoleaceae TaxID=1892252 RepID=UPI000B9AACCB|nr:hypothetical protein [Hydrocoleum sp. CS-953]OZH53972.1 hypothetical protein AFK68_13985 [Hydrocoleum sp. CS-953]
MKNLLKILPWLVIASFAWSLGFFYNVYYGGLIGRLRGMYYNKAALAAELEASKRLIIVGGSGAHYTVNSELMEEKLGISVFNFGLDGNLGLNVIFPTILEQVRPGDIVLIIPEYLMLLDEDGVGDRSTYFGFAIGKPGLGGIPPKKFGQDTFGLGVPSLRSLTKSTIDIVKKAEDPDYIPEYYADPITDWGDPTKTWGRKSKWWEMKVNKPVTPHSIARIKQFREELEAKEATLLISLPLIYGSTDEKTIKNVKKTAEELSKIAPTIYDQESLNLWTDSNLFADTHYHLKEEARVMRSKELIEQLQPIINQ